MALNLHIRKTVMRTKRMTVPINASSIHANPLNATHIEIPKVTNTGADTKKAKAHETDMTNDENRKA